MEWRIFLPVSKDEPPVDIWPLFGLGKLPSETREDLYVSCTEGVGLKIRGRIRFMEIKLRGQKYACGAEQWCKKATLSLSATDTSLCNLQRAFAKQLQQLCAKTLPDAEFIPSLDEALSVPWPDVLVSVAKQVTRGRVDDVSVEQSDLKVSVGGSQSLWRTVCIESNSLPNIQKLLKREVREGHVDLQDYLMGFANTIVQGYPAFILTLIQNTVSRDNGGTSSDQVIFYKTYQGVLTPETVK